MDRAPVSRTAEGLFDGVLARGCALVETSDAAWLAAMVEAEVALARAEARIGLLTDAQADAIESACRTASFDAEAIGREAAATGTPVVAIVGRIRAALDGPVGERVHYGATSQDIVDTATMLIARRALDVIIGDLEAAAAASARLATTHAATPMAARTLLQQALPTTFGLKAAVWMEGLDEAAALLARIRSDRLAAQLGGAVGTRATLGSNAPAVADAFAAELGLLSPVVPWHTIRVRIAELAAALGVAAGAAAKPARDVVLMTQTEVGEVHEGVLGRGGSSTLLHKRNPVAAVAVLASAARTPGLVSTILAAMPHEHERAAGAWHAEWLPLRDLFIATGSAAAWLADCLEHLEVDPTAMRNNLERGGGLLLTERIVEAIAPRLGVQGARRLIEEIVHEARIGGRQFGPLVAERFEADGLLPAAEVARLLDPEPYLESAAILVQRAVDAHTGRPRP
jgi:3-carboxy-cis,cis-muconate cycloisomerase